MSKNEREFPFYADKRTVYCSRRFLQHFNSKPIRVFDNSGLKFRDYFMECAGYAASAADIIDEKPAFDFADRYYEIINATRGIDTHLIGSLILMRRINEESSEGFISLEPTIAVRDGNKIAKTIKPDIILQNGRCCVVEVQGSHKLPPDKAKEISGYLGTIDAELIVAFPDYTKKETVRRNLEKIKGVEEKRAILYPSTSMIPFLMEDFDAAVIEEVEL